MYHWLSWNEDSIATHRRRRIRCLILQRMMRDNVKSIAETIREGVTSIDSALPENRTRPLSVSIGGIVGHGKWIHRRSFSDRRSQAVRSQTQWPQLRDAFSPISKTQPEMTHPSGLFSASRQTVAGSNGSTSFQRAISFAISAFSNASLSAAKDGNTKYARWNLSIS